MRTLDEDAGGVPRVRIWLAREAQDMRCGFDRLAERVRAVIAVLRELFAVEQQAKELSVAERLARRNRRRGWPNCARNCSAGRTNCYPSIPWPRR